MSPRLVASIGAGALAGVLSTVDPLLLRQLLDSALPRHQVRFALVLVIAIAICQMGRVIALIGGLRINTVIEQELSKNLRISLFERLTQLSAEYHAQTPAGETISRIETDVDQIASLSSEAVGSTVYATVFFSVNIVAMIHLSRSIALAILATLIFFWCLRALFAPALKRTAESVQGQTGRVTSLLCEYIPALPQIQLLVAEKLVLRKAVSALKELSRLRIRQRATESFFSGAINSALVLAIFVVLAIGSIQTLHGTLSVGALVAFYAYSARTFEPLSSMMDVYSRVQRIAASIRRVRAILEREPTVLDAGSIDAVTENLRTGITFANVSFSYNPHQQALDNLSFRICPGDRLALVGESGSGKSSLARLLVRLFDPQSGEITLDSNPLCNYSLSALRRIVCYVPQEPVLFDGSIEENLLHANPHASRDELARVTTLTQLHGVIDRLQHGLATRIGPSGHNLSGGERQRLALARALLTNAPVLIMDESTSALDSVTEHLLLHGILENYRASIFIIISHRVAALRYVDKFIVLERGRIRSSGNHESLYASCPVYKRLFERSGHVADECELNPSNR